MSSPWDALADWYAPYRESASSDNTAVEAPVIKRLLRKCAGLRILDVGCAAGYYTHWCATQGAKAVGVDLSFNMLVKAIERRSGYSAAFVLADAEGHIPFVDESFDIVLCSTLYRLVTEDEGLLSECCRVLKPGGRFILSDVHPLTHPIARARHTHTAPSSASYFDRSPYAIRLQRQKITVWPRTVGDTINAIVDAGFKILSACEPRPANGAVAAGAAPGVDPCAVPYYLIIEAQRP